MKEEGKGKGMMKLNVGGEVEWEWMGVLLLRLFFFVKITATNQDSLVYYTSDARHHLPMQM